MIAPVRSLLSLLILACVILFISPSTQGSFVLQNGTYQVKEGNLLSQTWKVATLEFDVGEDLYFPVMVPCIHCTAEDDYDHTKNDDGELCVCNYASRKGEGCGEAPKGCPKGTCADEDVKKYCNDKMLGDWTELEFSTKDDYVEYITKADQTLVQNEVKYYRLLATDPCRGYFVKLNFQFGIADMFYSTSIPEPSQINLDDNTDFTRYPDHIEMLLCPNDVLFNLGTFFFGIIGRSPNVSFDIDVYSSKTLHSTPNPELSVGATLNSKCADDPRYLCPKDGIQSKVGYPPPLLANNYYRIDFVTSEPGECREVTISLQCNSGDGDLYGAWDFRLNRTGAWYPTLRSSLQGSDVIFAQKCFDVPGKHYLYFNVDAWDFGEYFVTVSEKIKPFYKRGLDLSPYQYGYTATNYLYGRCPRRNMTCSNWGFSCTNMWSVYPSAEPDPFWPIPSVWNARSSPFSNSLFGTLREHEIPLLSTLHNKISVVVLMESTIFGKTTIYLYENELSFCNFTGLGVAFSKDGRGLFGTAGIKEKSVQCEREKFDQVLTVGRDYIQRLDEETTFTKLLQLTYQVNILMFTSSWLSCVNYVDSLINVTTSIVPTPSTACLESNTTSPNYINDPCCNSRLLLSQCCFERDVPMEKQFYGDILSSKLNRQCAAGSQECVKSYLGDYLVINKNSVQCTSFSSDEYPELVANSVSFYRDCKEKYNVDALALGIQTCRSDSECVFGGLKSKCNRVTNRCIGSYEVERATLRCIHDGLDTYSEYYLKEALELPGRKGGDDFFNALEKVLQTDQCIDVYGHRTSERRSQLYTTKSPTCGLVNGGCAKTSCLDTSCEITPTTCIGLCGMNWVELIKDSENNQEYCESKQKCNWMGDSCDEMEGDCEDDCKSVDSFCGYCTDPAHCVSIPGIKSKKDCEKAEACYLPDGKIELLSAEECKKRQSCSQPCHDDLGCESESGADDLCVSKESEGECNGEWSSKISRCTYPRYSQSLCEKANFTFYTCTGLSLTQCQACYNNKTGLCPVAQSLLKCHVVPRSQCATKSECESGGGFCEDALWYTKFGNINDDFGACVQNQSYSGFRAPPDCSRSPVFLSMTPAGCYSKTYTSKQKCAYRYISLAKNKTACSGVKGCTYFYQVGTLTATDKKPCEECGYEKEAYFKWTDGIWQKGEPIQLEWKEPQLETLHKWSPGVNFTTLYSYLVSAASATVLADLQSQALCDFNARSVPMEVASCACVADQEGSACFEESDKPLETGAGRPCIGLGARVQTYESSITVSDSAVDINSPTRCVEVSLSAISVYSYQQPERVAFSPLTKVRDYGTFNIVTNDDSAIVGRVMSNGLLVEMDGELQSYTICLTKLSELGSPPAKFNTWDVGVPQKGDKDFLRSLALTPKRESSDTYCFVIVKPELEQRYFLIARLSDPESEDGSLYRSEAIAWWIFAALYTILAIGTTVTFLSHFMGYKLHFYFLGLFIFLTIMCVVRGVYFFLLASGEFDESTVLAVAYFLIEFPTLLYFTAFSCLAAFWLFLLFAHRQNRHHRIVLFVDMVFNAILYILFVVFIILFQTLSSSSEAICPGRVPDNEDNTNQQIVSLVYQGIMAGVSLFIAIIVAFFGGKLYLTLQKRDFEGKIAIVTVICASGLLLHCGFILYLTATLEYNFTIIVLMIVLSELVPLYWVTFQFSLLRFCTDKRKIPSYNKRARFLRALNFFKSAKPSGFTLGTNTVNTTSGSSKNDAGSSQTSDKTNS